MKNQLEFLDIISIASFVIALQNLDYNVTQDDIVKTAEHLDKDLRANVVEIHEHLEEQDRKLSEILSRLEKLNGNT